MPKDPAQKKLSLKRSESNDSGEVKICLLLQKSIEITNLTRITLAPKPKIGDQAILAAARILQQMRNKALETASSLETTEHILHLNQIGIGGTESPTRFQVLIDFAEGKRTVPVSPRDVNKYRNKYDRILRANLRNQKSIETLTQEYGKTLAEYLYFTKLGISELESQLKNSKTGLVLKFTKTWWSLRYPWFCANPDACIVDKEGKIVCLVEFKTFSGKNQTGKRLDLQLQGYCQLFDLKNCLLITIKKENAKVKFKMRCFERGHELLEQASIGFVLNNLNFALELNPSHMLTPNDAKRALSFVK